MNEAVIQTRIIEVYRNPGDKDCNIPPLFTYMVDFRNIDLNRVESIDGVDINYTLKTL